MSTGNGICNGCNGDFTVKPQRQRLPAKNKNGSRYVYQCSHISTTKRAERVGGPPNVVTMCICQAILRPFSSHYVYTFIIYQGPPARSSIRNIRAHTQRGSDCKNFVVPFMATRVLGNAL